MATVSVSLRSVADTGAAMGWAGGHTVVVDRNAGKAGGTAPAVFNAANEVAVSAFLQGDLSFPGIAAAIENALSRWPGGEASTLDDVLRADAWARGVTQTFVRG